MVLRTRVRGRLACVALGWLVVIGAWQTADAADWRLSGAAGPPAGESVTYVLRGSPGQQYEVMVFAGARRCPRLQVLGGPAESLSSAGFLDEHGVDSRQLSFASGRSTICVYDGDTEAMVAGKVVRTTPGRDRLRITVTRKASFPADDAIVTAKGYVGRDGDPVFADAATQHQGTVVVTVRSARTSCPRTASNQHAQRTGATTVTTARFATELTIDNAFEGLDAPRLCGYLTARRRVPGGVRTRTVARAHLLIAGAIADEPDGVDDTNAEAIVGGILAWILVALLIAGVTALARKLWRTVGAPDCAGEAPSGPEHAISAAEATGPSSGYDFVQRRRDEDVSFAIQRAVGATADVYRDRLRLLLEHQDGPDWLAAFNGRRCSDMLAKGQPPPRAYESFEPRAVLACLAYDPAGLQLIGLDAADAARKLSGLANAAHHPDPDRPLADADYKRAWQLYTRITGFAAPFDTHHGSR